MKTKRALLGAAVLLVASGAASAEIFRCQSREGTTYQQIPCADAGAIEQKVGIATDYPDYAAARDRLAAREAAMDARLLRRLEIESAERIARDERVARENEAQAERDRLAQAQAQGGGVYVIPTALRPMRPHTRPRAASSSLR